MASINDLKTSNNYTGNGTASGMEGGVLEIPNPNMKKRVNPTGVAKQNNGKPTTAKPERKIADLSILPGEEPDENVKQSIEDEILKDGGPFEEYKARKIAEMEEINNLIDEHNAMVAAERGEEVPSDEELEEMEERGEATRNMTEVLRGTKYYDEADNFGRGRGDIEVSPLDDGLVNNPQISQDELQDLDQSPDTTKSDSDEDDDDDFEKEMEEMEGQIGLIDPVEEKEGTVDDDDIVEVTDSNIEAEIEKEETPKQDVVNPVKKPEPGIASIPKKEEKQISPVTSKDVTDSLKRLSEKDKIDVNIDEEFDEDSDAEEGTTSAIVNITEVDPDQNMKEFQAAVSEKIHTVNKKLNLSSFKVISAPISVSKATLEPNTETAMSWALPCTGQHISMREWSGKELERLSENSGANNFQILKNRYKAIYDHVTSPKPDTLEAWLKTISFQDDDHLYFTIYGASFSGSNFIPYDCPACKNTFLSDNFTLESMYKFKDDKTKEKFNKLKDSQDDTAKTGLYTTEVVQISDKFAIGFRDPSLWNVMFEPALLDDKFISKYSDIITIVSYIDNIYVIGDGTLQPIGYKIDTNNAAKTVKARVFTYAKILSTLTSDQYYTIMAYLSQINTIGDGVTFIKPEVSCPNCQTVIPETTVRASDMLFSRSQLATLSLTSLS